MLHADNYPTKTKAEWKLKQVHKQLYLDKAYIFKHVDWMSHEQLNK